MTSDQYWKIRALALAVELERERAATRVTTAEARLNSALSEAGLDPARRIRFDDATERLIPLPEPATLSQD